MARFAAFIVLLIPGLMAAGGIKLMRDTLFAKLVDPIPFLWLQFIIGIALFVIGFGFFAGFLLHRDRKKGKFQLNLQIKRTLTVNGQRPFLYTSNSSRKICNPANYGFMWIFEILFITSNVIEPTLLFSYYTCIQIFRFIIPCFVSMNSIDIWKVF